MPYDPSRLDGPNDRRRPAGRPLNQEAGKSPGSAFKKASRKKKDNSVAKAFNKGYKTT